MRSKWKGSSELGYRIGRYEFLRKIRFQVSQVGSVVMVHDGRKLVRLVVREGMVGLPAAMFLLTRRTGRKIHRIIIKIYGWDGKSNRISIDSE